MVPFQMEFCCTMFEKLEWLNDVGLSYDIKI